MHRIAGPTRGYEVCKQDTPIDWQLGQTTWQVTTPMGGPDYPPNLRLRLLDAAAFHAMVMGDHHVVIVVTATVRPHRRHSSAYLLWDIERLVRHWSYYNHRSNCHRLR